MIRRFDLLSRMAYGVLCVAGMSMIAVPLLFAVGPIGAIVNLIEGDEWRAFWVWVGSWIACGFAVTLFLACAYVAWPLAADWITEWRGYLIATVIGAIGLGSMILVVFVTTWPLAVEILVPLAGTFLVGFALPGRLLGLGATSALPGERLKARQRKHAGTP